MIELFQFFNEVHQMAVSVQNILDKVTAIGAEIQSIRDFITANPPAATQAQLQQISDGMDVNKAGLDALSTQVGKNPNP
jgi:hypothetical protein